MRRPFVFFACFAAGLIGSLEARADDAARSIDAVILDAEAASFFESALRGSQARRIEADTAHYYRSLNADARRAFRAARRAEWASMSEEERAALRSAKSPAFANLTDEQKSVFRRNAAFTLFHAEPRGVTARGAEI